MGLHKPTSIAFDCTDDFRFYKSGVFSSDSCGTQPKDVNHAVLAVGYGTENGADFWLVRVLLSYSPVWSEWSVIVHRRSQPEENRQYGSSTPFSRDPFAVSRRLPKSRLL